MTALWTTSHHQTQRANGVGLQITVYEERGTASQKRGRWRPILSWVTRICVVKAALRARGANDLLSELHRRKRATWGDFQSEVVKEMKKACPAPTYVLVFDALPGQTFTFETLALRMQDEHSFRTKQRAIARTTLGVTRVGRGSVGSSKFRRGLKIRSLRIRWVGHEVRFVDVRGWEQCPARFPGILKKHENILLRVGRTCS